MFWLVSDQINHVIQSLLFNSQFSPAWLRQTITEFSHHLIPVARESIFAPHFSIKPKCCNPEMPKIILWVFLFCASWRTPYRWSNGTRVHDNNKWSFWGWTEILHRRNIWHIQLWKFKLKVTSYRQKLMQQQIQYAVS